jgi:hypothetical protein
MTIDDFKKIFCKCIFKEALLNMFEAIEKLSTIKGKGDIPLTLKLGTY